MLTADGSSGRTSPHAPVTRSIAAGSRGVHTIDAQRPTVRSHPDRTLTDVFALLILLVGVAVVLARHAHPWPLIGRRRADPPQPGDA
jgi:hypothetical protein